MNCLTDITYGDLLNSFLSLLNFIAVIYIYLRINKKIREHDYYFKTLIKYYNYLSNSAIELNQIYNNNYINIDLSKYEEVFINIIKNIETMQNYTIFYDIQKGDIQDKLKILQDSCFELKRCISVMYEKPNLNPNKKETLNNVNLQLLNQIRDKIKKIGNLIYKV